MRCANPATLRSQNGVRILELRDILSLLTYSGRGIPSPFFFENFQKNDVVMETGLMRSHHDAHRLLKNSSIITSTNGILYTAGIDTPRPK
jgi:hypothetical protein